jgi:hypothetical protein
MSEIDTSAEAVEKVCSGLCEYNAHLRLREKPDAGGRIPPIHASWLQIAEDTLRALLAERDALRGEVEARIAAAVAEEREACAKWHDEQARVFRDPFFLSLPAAPGPLVCAHRAMIHELSAAAIRAGEARREQ